MFFADAVGNEPSTNVQVAPIDGSESSVYNAAKFMVDAFWLQSPQQLIQTPDDSIPEISEPVKSKLITQQADDLMKKYGERLGKRKLDACLLVALDCGDIGGTLSSTDNVLGMVTIEVRLLDAGSGDILGADVSEHMLTQAVASLPPSKRREYKNASVMDIVRELLSSEISAVCSLSNLCVAPSARRKGVAAKLCEEAERLAKEKFGFDEMFLRVEAENEAAKRLYDAKLGYESKFEVISATALRVDGVSGAFVEVTSNIAVMSKKL